ncbi:translation initiation factor IF-2 [Candidatus Pacearchaeota archaeon]|nr:MAG: translation initiation factor IF-2 [Candidatus Pacearchaeota archaeon]
MKLRQPIVTVAGHVDHGKTSILDKIRELSIQDKEAGGITQKISFTVLPREIIQKKAGDSLKKFNIPMNIPGILFIDTPGHAAFTNLRKRGGSLADIAILVIDINEGIKPQTSEVLQIFRSNKTPFIIALNKIDNIRGWKKSPSGLSIESVQNQAIAIQQEFNEKYLTIVGALQSFGFDSELYFKIKDFTKKVAMVPCSAKTGEGISEILAVLYALSQKYLTEKIKVHSNAKGVILEIKKEKSGSFLECILYDGILSIKDEIAIATLKEPIITRIRSLREALPRNSGFEAKEKVEAAAGLQIQITSKEEVLPGMPFQKIDKNLDEIREEFKKQISEEIKTDESGIVAKAESLGSLEAFLILLRQNGIRVIRAGIGPITKKDIYTAATLPEEDRLIAAFNVEISEEAKEDSSKIKIIKNQVIYKLIEDILEWRKNKAREIEKRKLESLPSIAKIRILDFVFRNSNPAVFGIKVEAGKLKREEKLINSEGERIGHIKEIQEEKTGIKEAEAGKEVAVSMPGVNFERRLKVGEFLYTDISESQFRKFKEYKDLLTSEEKSILQEIAKIKRRENPSWGI